MITASWSKCRVALEVLYFNNNVSLLRCFYLLNGFNVYIQLFMSV